MGMCIALLVVVHVPQLTVDGMVCLELTATASNTVDLSGKTGHVPFYLASEICAKLVEAESTQAFSFVTTRQKVDFV